jgi:hypothetical protein
VRLGHGLPVFSFLGESAAILLQCIKFSINMPVKLARFFDTATHMTTPFIFCGEDVAHVEPMLFFFSHTVGYEVFEHYCRHGIRL